MRPDEQFAVHGEVSPLIGREAELSALDAALARATSFHAPQFVILIGNQGTGKSRLLAEWQKRIKPPVRVCRGRAPGRGVKYGAVARLLRHRFGLADGDDGDGARNRFRDTLQQVFNDRRVGEVVHVLGGFLGFQFEESPFLRAFDDNPRQADEIGRAVLRRFFEIDATAAPLVLLFDDLQEADQDTLELLGELGEGLSGSPVVIVCAGRPEMLVRRPELQRGGEATRLELRNLETKDAARLFRRLLMRADKVPDDLVEDAVEMTGGNPFFLEELVRLFCANGTIDAKGTTWRLDPVKAAETELPMSVEQAVEARVAALAPDELDLLEKGSIFGNVFWLSGVIAINRLDRLLADADKGRTPPPPPTGWQEDGLRARVQQRVEALAKRDYVLVLPGSDSTIAGDVEIVFKHNLERDLVWRMIDETRRRRYTRIAAQWLETKLGERSEAELELLGQLYERAGDEQRGARAYMAAAARARGRWANGQAVELYRRALGLIQWDDVTARLEVVHDLGTVLVHMGRADDAAYYFHEMLRVAWLFDVPGKGGAAHSRIGRIYRQRGEIERALAHFRLAYELFERAGDRRGLAGVQDDVGTLHWMHGAYDLALERHQAGLALRRQLGDRRSIAVSLAHIGRVHHERGAFAAALSCFQEALDFRRDISDLPGVVSSLCDVGAVHQADGRLGEAHAAYSQAWKLAVEVGDKLGQAQVLGRLGEVEVLEGRGDVAEQHLLQASELVAILGDRLGQSDVARRLADLYVARGDFVRARAEAERAVDLASRIGSRAQLGVCQRLLAEIQAAVRSPEAEQTFKHAVDVLTEVRNELELARTFRAFAEWREREGRSGDAVTLRLRADEIFSRLKSGTGRAPTARGAV